MTVPSRHDVQVSVGGEAPTRTAYWQYGDGAGEPLVMVHGFRGDHHGLEGIAQELTQYRVIVPDLPGFGASERLHRAHDLAGFSAWLRAFVPLVATDSYALLGHSFGSLVVSRAVHDGVTPQKLILVNPISSPALEGPRAVLTKLAIGYYRAATHLPEVVADRVLRDPLIVRIMSEAMAKTKNRSLRSWIHEQHAQYFSDYTDRQSLLEAFTASVSHTVGAYVGAFTMPTQIIAGEVDDITPLIQQLRLAREVPGSVFRVISGSGHLVHYEATAECAAHIDAFLQGELRA